MYFGSGQAKRFLFLVMMLTFIASAFAKEYNTDKRMLIEEGLSQNRITCIVEDNLGYMWFGTADGLNRYDGYNFKIYRNIIGEKNSLCNNNIESLAQDSSGYIWIGTDKGLSCFNPYNEQFVTLMENDSILDQQGANVVSNCVVDKNDNIWCGTSGAGIFMVEKGTFKRKYISFEDNGEDYSVINTLMIDDQNRLWIGLVGSLNVSVYSIDEDKVELYQIGHKLKNIDGKLRVTDIYQSKTGKIWLSLIDYSYQRGGLFFLDENADSIKNVCDQLIIHKSKLAEDYCSNFSILNSISGDGQGNVFLSSLLGGVFCISNNFEPKTDYVESPVDNPGNLCVYYAKNGILWIGTNGKGIQVSLTRNADFKLLNPEVDPEFSIESIRSISEIDDYYWIGGYHGIIKVNKDFSQFKYLFESNVYSIAKNINNNDLLWIGSEGAGLISYNIATSERNMLTFEQAQTERYLCNYVYKVLSISDSLILLGTEGGVSGFNPVTNDIFYFDQIIEDKDKPWKMSAKYIDYDCFGNILVGFTQGKVGLVNLKDTVVVDYSKISQSDFSENYNPVNCIYSDSSKYWIATSNGLYSVNIKTKETRLFTEKDGLPNSHIYAILPDDVNRIWMSTNNGITCYDPQSGKFQNFDISDGLQSNEFNTGAYYKASDGTLFFGGINGVNYFKPSSIKYNRIPAKIVITEIKIGNKNVFLDKKIIEDRELLIQPDENVFTIEFSGLSFINSFKNEYKYRIKQIKDEWIDLGTTHRISFNNMSPGNYTLEILASNNHGVWLKEPYVLNIIVVPRFYETKYFVIIIIISFIVVAFFFNKIRVVRVEKQREKLQLLVDEQTKNLSDTNKILKTEISEHKKTAKDLVASNNTKDKFISIIAHDILNPLGVIQGFSEIINTNHEDLSLEEIVEYNRNVYITARSLNVLISNLLQWSKLENKKIVPCPEIIHLNKNVNSCLRLLTGLINEKKLNLIVNIDDSIIIYTDFNMFCTIIRNLVSNSIKFTPYGGTIILSAISTNNRTVITVEDNGVGIPADKLNTIFESNGKYSTKGTNNESGTGLGLTLVHEFVIMNHGEIKVESEVGSGTIFTIELPMKGNVV